MTPENKQKFKEWASRNRDEILASTVFITVGGAFVALMVASVKEQNRAIESWNAHVKEMNNWLNTEEENGNDVYELLDSSYLTVPKNSPVKRVIK
jgi:type II secretory pathway component PulM